MSVSMNKTKKITAMGLMAALAFVVMLFCKLLPPMFSAFPFLSYDAKDVVVVIGGFVFGPGAAFMISVVVSVIEMMSVSDTNIIGCIMNIISTCAFACSAAAIYNRFRSLKGACSALTAGSVCATATMLVLNFLLTPIYMNLPRETVASLLVPAILPFNIIKCVLNSAFTLIIYKPFVNVLRRSNLVADNESASGSAMGVVAAAILLIVVCTLAICIINR